MWRRGCLLPVYLSLFFLLLILLVLITLLALPDGLDEGFHDFEEALFAARLCALLVPVEDSLGREDVVVVQELDDPREEVEELYMVVNVDLDRVAVAVPICRVGGWSAWIWVANVEQESNELCRRRHGV